MLRVQPTAFLTPRRRQAGSERRRMMQSQGKTDKFSKKKRTPKLSVFVRRQSQRNLIEQRHGAPTFIMRVKRVITCATGKVVFTWRGKQRYRTHHYPMFLRTGAILFTQEDLLPGRSFSRWEGSSKRLSRRSFTASPKILTRAPSIAAPREPPKISSGRLGSAWVAVRARCG